MAETPLGGEIGRKSVERRRNRRRSAETGRTADVPRPRVRGARQAQSRSDGASVSHIESHASSQEMSAITNSGQEGVESTEAITSARDASDAAVAFGVMYDTV
ncbi:hypothetical protein C474_10436 [Halogeometricum pallidum JCM 14848]|uniref:Uncharacterized protein n=1 Tax=Halogeometricum pallidum JCM 14848 TaxID=1227487 RepID=M0D851_HALPD|nr:hypothetical protein C474_10436 [Halogeometricum pallidum JCM 14848]